MATDGVKIIDGDTAHDIYSTFMKLYDEGAAIEDLLQQFENDKQQNSYDKEEYEICITAYALAFWEIGALSPSMLTEVKDVIAQGATIIGWTQDVGEEAGKARKKELEKFFIKISTPNKKPRKSKGYKKITNLLLKKGDILAFQNLDKTYSLTVVTGISQEKGKCYYSFCRTVNKMAHAPELKDVENIEAVGTRMGINITPYL